MTNFNLPKTFQAVPRKTAFGTDFKIIIDADDPPAYDQAVLAHPLLNFDISVLILNLIGTSGTLIDLGANIGTVSLHVASLGHRTVAIEMLPSNVSKLTMAVLVNRLTRFRIVQAAVSDNDGMIGYIGSEAWGQVSSVPGATQAVAMKLDTIVELIALEDDPNFFAGAMVLKVDVEDHELAAISGAKNTLAKFRPAIVFESKASEPNSVKVQRLLVESGYQLFITRGNILSPHLPGDIQASLISDILAIPEEKAEALIMSLREVYQVRALSIGEQLDWLDEMTLFQTVHQMHVVKQASKFLSAHPESRARILEIETKARRAIQLDSITPEIEITYPSPPG